MDTCYLKSTIRSGWSSIGIRCDITLKLRDSDHFLQKKSRMNYSIYHQVVDKIGSLFDKYHVCARVFMI